MYYQLESTAERRARRNRDIKNLFHPFTFTVGLAV